MNVLALVVATGLGAAVGFGMGRLKSWIAKHEEIPHANLDSPLLKTRLRIRGIAVKGVVPNAKV